MAYNPLVPQGVINKLLATVSITNLPGLNITPSYLTPEGISMAFEGDASALLETMTSGVPSPNPYQRCTVSIRLVRSAGLAAAWKSQVETSTVLGDVVVTPDTAAMPPYYLTQCVIRSAPGDLALAGASPEWMLMLHGIYQINSALFA